MLDVTKQTQRMDVGATMEKRARDHEVLADLCRDPLAKAELKREAAELREDARRLKQRVLL